MASRKHGPESGGRTAGREQLEERGRLLMDVTGLCGIWTGDVVAGGEGDLKILMLKGMEEIRHRPVLTFNMRSFVSLASTSESPRRIEVVQLPNGEQIGSWELEGKVVRLSHLTDATPETVKLLGERIPPAESPSTPTEEFGLHWMPSVGRACGQEDARVHARYLGDHPGLNGGGDGREADDKVLARFDLPQGFIYSSAAVNRLRDPDIWEFTDGRSVVMKQFIAETVRCEVRDLPSDQVAIVASPYGRPEVEESLLLRTWDDSIRLTLTNLPTVDIPAPDEFRHFMAYYEILDPVPDLSSRSKPVKAPARGRGRGPLVDDPALAPRPEPPDGGVTARGVRPVMCSPGGYP